MGTEMTNIRWTELEAKRSHRLSTSDWTEIKAYIYWLKEQIADQNYSVLSDKYVELLAEKKCLELDILEARMLATKQADDWGLWFVTTAAPEQYLQDALRELNLAVASCG